LIVIALTVLSIVLAICLTVSVVLLVKLGRFVLDLEDRVDESLDTLDETYKNITGILEIPVMTDEPFIRQVLGDIRRARGAIVEIANKISTFNDPNDDAEEK